MREKWLNWKLDMWSKILNYSLQSKFRITNKLRKIVKKKK